MYNEKIIGLDYDDMKHAKQMFRIIKILKLRGKWRKSSSGRGIHIRIEVNKHNKKENLLIRYMLGDCYGRFMGDVRRLQHGLKEFEILFDHKNGKTSGQWRKIR